MNTKQVACAAGFVFLIAVALYYANMSTSDNSYPIPKVQGEAQVMGMGVQAGMRVNAGTPLDCHPDTHFWSPGLDPDAAAVSTVKTPHRYPAIPGGNISTIMHKGWGAFNDSAPDDTWFRNPPEAAVL